MNQDKALSVEYGETYNDNSVQVLDRFEYWAASTPDAVAVEQDESTYTYGELSQLANRCVQALADGVRRGEVVGVCLEQSVALVAVAVAIARLGAIYLPLGPRPGARRLAAVTDQLPVTCLISTPELLPARHAAEVPIMLPISGRSGEQVVAASTTEDPDQRSTVPDETFYLVLTSGTTGAPKAVAVGHSSFATLQRWHAERTGSGPGDRHSLLAGVAFDAHVKELWAALTTGATLIVAPPQVRLDPIALTDWWRDTGVTLAFLPTPLAELVFERPWPDLPVLRRLEVGGDRLRRWPSADVTAIVDNAYGPAEATVLTTAHTLLPAEGNTTVPPIGRPLAGAMVCVTDDEGALVPRGEPGELRIGGSCLALGYLDAELTDQRFVPAPQGVRADRVYCTGDRVRMRADGVLEFLARMDDQVKVSGVRIEPAEVEAAFEHNPRVRRAAVVARNRPDATTRLIAFLQPIPDQDWPDIAALLREVRDWLPEQAVPSVVRLVDRFPLDANGKVDKAALLATLPGPAPAPVVAGPATVSEETVVRLCQKLLGTNEVGPLDNFVEAGGTSLLAARLLAALEETFEVRLRAPEVLSQPDLRALTTLVDSRRTTAPMPAGA
ncbi:amino acid adenylation domain-containing protein [Nocardia brasiliensis]|uniref:amino acid adenylation domain-containing protein n=1 Tax=Nocardia brasiliensis TaxID=37326 RepID=UPI002455E6A0|nr:amino acid adenylation domain-containing protein [Nocardia brasiliensis]